MVRRVMTHQKYRTIDTHRMLPIIGEANDVISPLRWWLRVAEWWQTESSSTMPLEIWLRERSGFMQWLLRDNNSSRSYHMYYTTMYSLFAVVCVALLIDGWLVSVWVLVPTNTLVLYLIIMPTSHSFVIIIIIIGMTGERLGVIMYTANTLVRTNIIPAFGCLFVGQILLSYLILSYLILPRSILCSFAWHEHRRSVCLLKANKKGDESCD